MNAVVLEGAEHSIMRGWTHFQILIRHNGGVKVTSSIGVAGSGEKTARELRGKFFPRGTWELENHVHVAVNRFHAPRPEVLDLLVSQKQAELAV